MSRTLFGRGIALRFTLGLGATLIFAVVSITALFVVGGQRVVRDRTQVESQSLTKTVAAALANAVVLREYAFIIEHCMLVLRSRNDLLYIVVVKADGTSLIHRPDGWRAEVLRDPVSRAASR